MDRYDFEQQRYWMLQTITDEKLRASLELWTDTLAVDFTYNQVLTQLQVLLNCLAV